MVNKPLLEKVRQRKYSNTSMVSREKKHTAYRHFEANYFMSRGGKIKLGFSLFAKGNFQTAKGGAVLLPRAKNKGIFGGKQISANRYLPTSLLPLLHFSSFLQIFCNKEKVFFSISDFGLVAVCFHLALGSPSLPGQCVPLFFGKANAKGVWSGRDGGGGGWADKSASPVPSSIFLQNHKTAKRTLVLHLPLIDQIYLPVCVSFVMSISPIFSC